MRREWFVAGVVLSAGGLFGLAVGGLTTFKAGDIIRSSEVNANFSTLRSAIQALEVPVETARIADGAVTGSKLSLPLILSGTFSTSELLVVGNNAGNAVKGVSANGIGLLGRSPSRGVVGTQGSMGLPCAGTYGVGGCAEGGAGVWGLSETGNGVVGIGMANDAILGRSYSPNHAGIVGVNQNGGFAAYFEAGSAVCSFKSGTTGWTCSSDKTLKENFRAVDTAKVLEAVVHMPITTWNLKGFKVRQIGPSAQDFYAAFQLGGDDKSINSTDAQGVALAAIQGLNAKLEARNKVLEAQVRDVERRLADLQERMEALAAALEVSEKR